MKPNQTKLKQNFLSKPQLEMIYNNLIKSRQESYIATRSFLQLVFKLQCVSTFYANIKKLQ